MPREYGEGPPPEEMGLKPEETEITTPGEHEEAREGLLELAREIDQETEKPPIDLADHARELAEGEDVQGERPLGKDELYHSTLGRERYFALTAGLGVDRVMYRNLAKTVVERFERGGKENIRSKDLKLDRKFVEETLRGMKEKLQDPDWAPYMDEKKGRDKEGGLLAHDVVGVRQEVGENPQEWFERTKQKYEKAGEKEQTKIKMEARAFGLAALANNDLESAIDPLLLSDEMRRPKVAEMVKESMERLRWRGRPEDKKLLAEISKKLLATNWSRGRHA